MDKATLAEKLKIALDNYTSYKSGDVDSVIIYMRRAETYLKRNGNSSEVLERLILQSKDKIIRNNIGLIKRIAKEFANSKEKPFDYDDFFSEGNIGLLDIISRGFVPRKGKFSNYAATTIRQRINRRKREIRENIRLPINIFFYQKKMDYYFKCFKEKYEKIPTDEELAVFSGMPVETITRLRKSRKFFFTPSLDEKLDEKETNGDSVITHVSSNYCLEEDVFNKMLYEQRVQLINQLPDKKERRVLHGRLVEGKTFKEIGKEMGISKQRVEQIKKSAIKKLKQMEDFEELTEN